MRDFIIATLKSRAFWTGLGPAIVAFCTLIGRPLGDEQAQALAIILSAIAGWVTVTATRAQAGSPVSYARAKQLRRARGS